MADLESISRRVRQFYAQVDPTKTEAQLDEITFAIFTNGEESVNAQMRAKYGRDLNGPATAAGIPIAQAVPLQQQQPVYATTTVPTFGPNGGVILGPPNSTMQIPGMVYTQPLAQNVVLSRTNGVILVPQNGAQPVVITQQPNQGIVYVQQAPGPTPFASSATYQYGSSQQRQEDTLCCCLYLLGSLACLECCLC